MATIMAFHGGLLITVSGYRRYNKKLSIIHISVQSKSIGNIQNYEALEGVYWTT
jgi:hypothetical protein